MMKVERVGKVMSQQSSTLGRVVAEGSQGSLTTTMCAEPTEPLPSRVSRVESRNVDRSNTKTILPQIPESCKGAERRPAEVRLTGVVSLQRERYNHEPKIFGVETGTEIRKLGDRSVKRIMIFKGITTWWSHDGSPHILVWEEPREPLC